jgi:peptidyl-prolyl cis-trans isomerase D
MIGTIRRHQTWLWAIIITLTIGSFVVFGPTNTRMGNIFGSQKENLGTLAGQPVTRAALDNSVKEVLLDYFLKHDQWPNEQSVDVLREAYWRLMIIQKQKDLGVEVSTEAIANFAHRFIPAAAGASDNYADTKLKPHGLDLSDLQNYLRHELGLQQLILAAGVSGKLVTPQEAEAMYRLEHREVESSIVFFSASNYMSSVPILPLMVAQFYTNQLANYRVPEQVQVNYVKFAGSNYVTQAMATLTNLEQILDEETRRMGTNLYQGAKTPAESREAMKQDVIRQASVMAARKVAGEFAQKLDDMPTHSLAAFASLAATNGLVVKTTEPFDREYGPQDIRVPPAFTKTAFGLTKDDMYGGPIKADDAVYVIALVAQNPSRLPPFNEIEAKVTADYRYGSAFQLAQQSAIKFMNALTNGLEAGKSFSSLCAQSGVRSESLPVLSLDTRSLPESIENRIDAASLVKLAFNTVPGKAGISGARDGAYVIYVERQLPVDEAKMKANFTAYLTRVREVRQDDAFQQWFYYQLRQDPEFLGYVQQLGQKPQLKSNDAQRSKS